MAPLNSRTLSFNSWTKGCNSLNQNGDDDYCDDDNGDIGSSVYGIGGGGCGGGSGGGCGRSDGNFILLL